ncbi:MAG: NAD+ synthase [Gemmatimonadetes bacterium]|nr:NAD+ synthase [Gemmatimonadota bacterium]
MEPRTVRRILVSFLRHETQVAGLSRGVLGLSGGIDSAVVCHLAAEALGPENVTAVMMPADTSSPASLADAERVAADTGVQTRVVPIGDMAAGYLKHAPDASPLRRGNVFARCRMIVLYDVSAEVSGLVFGTSNKTELLLGYGTLFGDLASAINPIGDLYKTHVRALATELGVAETVRTKPPTADLWAGQSDEQELGATYEELDALLFRLIDERVGPDRLVDEGFDEAFVRSISRRVRVNQYKRRPPLIAKLTTRTIGPDFRYPRDGGGARDRRLPPRAR